MCAAHTETVNQVKTRGDNYTPYVAASAIKSTRVKKKEEEEFNLI